MSRIVIATLLALMLGAPAFAAPICEAVDQDLSADAALMAGRVVASQQPAPDLRLRRFPLPDQAVAPIGLLVLLALQEGLAIR